MRMREIGKRAAVGFLAGVIALGLFACSDGKTALPKGTAELGKIQAVTRESKSGTRASFDDLIGIVSEADGLTEADSTGKMLETVKGGKAAIGYLTQDALTDEVKALTVGGKKTDDSGYPLTRRLYLVYKGTPSDLEQEFLTFVTGKGQAIVEKSFEPVKEVASFLSMKPAGSLRITGSSSEAPVMEKLAASYMKENPNAKITVETSDSGSGIRDALEGRCDLGMSSRNPKSYEKDLLTFTPVAKDRIAVIVQKENPLSDISVDQLKDIYSGTAEKWSDLAGK